MGPQGSNLIRLLSNMYFLHLFYETIEFNRKPDWFQKTNGISRIIFGLNLHPFNGFETLHYLFHLFRILERLGPLTK